MATARTYRPQLPMELMGRTGPFDPPPGLAALPNRVTRLAMRDGEPFWLVSGYAEARAMLSDPRFSADRYRAGGMLSHLSVADRDKLMRSRAGFFGAMDPPEHTRYRRFLTAWFTTRRMRDLGARIEEIVTAHLDAMLAEGTTADLVTRFAQPVPSRVVCELLGVPERDRAELHDRTDSLMRVAAPVEETLAARDQLRDLVRRLVRHKREQPGDDLISGLLHHPLTEDELVNMAYTVLAAGHETTVNMLALGTFALLEQPAQLAAVRAEPALVEGAVEELLRYLTIVGLGLYRHASEDVHVAGQLIPAGALVVISLLGANRDHGYWSRPDTVDVTRRRNPHLAFGYGVHQCLGQQLARTQLTIGFRHLLRRLPNLRLAVPAGEIPLRGDMAVYGVYSLPVAWDRVNSTAGSA